MAVVGISHEVVRNTLIAQGMPPVQAATFPGIEHEVVRDALAAKALGGPVAGAPTVVAAAGGSAGTAKALTTGGTLWSGKGFSLGLGLGLGIWGPILVGAAGAAAAYAYFRYRQQQLAQAEVAVEDEGFMASAG
ncbi:MAG: hypothetical protein WCF85_00475 [Rhodospirillaceae bacterium]